MAISSRRIINKDAAGTLTTNDVDAGLFNDEQAETFYKMVQEATVLGGLVSHELHRAKKGEIDKIGVNKRLLRAKVENTAPGELQQPEFAKVEYSTNALVLPFEITNDYYRQNIEKEKGEDTIMQLFANQLSIDKDDLAINGDEDTPSTDPDYKFLKNNDGWIKQIKNGSHVLDAKSATKLSSDFFFNARKLIPSKYNVNGVNWAMSPYVAQSWQQSLNAIAEAGGHPSESFYRAPAGIPIKEIPQWADDSIGLFDPANLCDIATYSVKIACDSTSKDVISRDVRFYIMHFDFDAIIYELEACGIITNLKL